MVCLLAFTLFYCLFVIFDCVEMLVVVCVVVAGDGFHGCVVECLLFGLFCVLLFGDLYLVLALVGCF